MFKLSKIDRKLAILHVIYEFENTPHDKLPLMLESMTPYTISNVIGITPQYCNTLLRELVSDGYLTREARDTSGKPYAYEYIMTRSGFNHYDALSFLVQRAIDRTVEFKRQEVTFWSI